MLDGQETAKYVDLRERARDSLADKAGVVLLRSAPHLRSTASGGDGGRREGQGVECKQGGHRQPGSVSR